MADSFIAIDTAKPAGEQFAPEVVAEIATVAPSAVVNGSITTAKLADDAVTTAKLAPGAVGSTEIGTAAIETLNYASASVTTPKLADDAVTPPKCGTGVVTAVDSANNPAETALKFVTAAQYAAIGTPDPNTVYMVSP